MTDAPSSRPVGRGDELGGLNRWRDGPYQESVLKVWADTIFGAYVDYRLKVVLVTRTTRPFRKIDDVTEAYARLEREVRPYASCERALLVDSRAAPMLDPAFEPAFHGANMRLFEPFRTTCVLVGTRFGLLQGQRIKSRAVVFGTVSITSSCEAAASRVGAPGLLQLLRDGFDAGASAGR